MPVTVAAGAGAALVHAAGCDASAVQLVVTDAETNRGWLVGHGHAPYKVS